jgi:hypothetical protein
LQHFAGLEGEFYEIASAVNERGAGAGEFFQNEALASEETGSEAFGERDVELDGSLGADKAVALDQDGLSGG